MGVQISLYDPTFSFWWCILGRGNAESDGNCTLIFWRTNILLTSCAILYSSLCVSRSVMSDSLPPRRLQPTRLLCPWESQARILKWVAISFFRGSSQPRGRTHVSCIVGRFFTIWTTGAMHIFPVAISRHPHQNFWGFLFAWGFFFFLAILVGVKWCLIVVLIFISLTMMMVIFSCAYWPFIYLL